MLLRQVNDAMLIEDAINDVLIAYVEGSPLSVELNDEQSQFAIECSNVRFEAFIKLLILDAEYDKMMMEQLLSEEWG